MRSEPLPTTIQDRLLVLGLGRVTTVIGGLFVQKMNLPHNGLDGAQG
jgi:hypothetical protein